MQPFRLLIFHSASKALLLATLLLTAACGGKQAETPADARMEDAAARAADEAAPSSSAQKDASQSTAEGLPPPAAQERKRIYQADLKLRVRDLKESEQKLQQLMNQHRVLLESKRQDLGYGVKQLVYSIRVAPERFQPFLDAAEALGIQTEQLSVQALDMTQEYRDLESRLATKRAALEQYIAFMRRAATVEDILNIQDRIRVLQEEIDLAENRKRNIDRDVQLSQITLTLSQQVDGYEPAAESFPSKLWDSLKDGWAFLTELLLFLVRIWPVYLLGAIAWGVYRWWKRRKQ